MPGRITTLVRPIAARAYHTLYRCVLPVRFLIADMFPAAVRNGLPLPPAKLRFRVSETTSPSEFFRVGQEAAANIRTILRDEGYSMARFADVLDFGCGCGRTLMWLRQQNPDVHWHGTDVDPEAIQWCRTNLASGSFSENTPLPPLSYPDSIFDFVYGISVFTHLDENHQRLWLPELRRVLKPGGLLLLTVYSEDVWKGLGVAAEVEDKGFVFRRSAKLRGIHPEWYQTAFQTRARLTALVSRHFAEFKLLPCGLGSHDVILARRN
jgi:SAM-dependent methyltransferase